MIISIFVWFQGLIRLWPSSLHFAIFSTVVVLSNRFLIHRTFVWLGFIWGIKEAECLECVRVWCTVCGTTVDQTVQSRVCGMLTTAQGEAGKETFEYVSWFDVRCCFSSGMNCNPFARRPCSFLRPYCCRMQSQGKRRPSIWRCREMLGAFHLEPVRCLDSSFTCMIPRWISPNRALKTHSKSSRDVRTTTSFELFWIYSFEPYSLVHLLRGLDLTA